MTDGEARSGAGCSVPRFAGRGFAGVEVWTADPAATAAASAAFGFEPTEPSGEDSVCDLVHCERREGPRLRVRVADAATATGPPAPTRADPWRRGPRALDLYVRDLELALDHLAAGDVGVAVSPVGELAAGPMRMRQAMLDIPYLPPLVLVESTHRRSSRLDEAGCTAMFSEPHSVVWVVDDLDGERAVWADAGWTASPPITFENESICAEMNMGCTVPMTMAMISDPAVSAMRVELMELGSAGPSSPAPGSPPTTLGTAPASTAWLGAILVHAGADVAGREPGGPPRRTMVRSVDV